MAIRILFLASLLATLCSACGKLPSNNIDIQAEQQAATLIAARPTAFPPTTTQEPTLTPSPTQNSKPTSMPQPTRKPTSKPTNEPTQCSGIILSDRKTSKGIYIQVKGCSSDLEYEIGPLSNGVYAVGPNQEFLVYCSNDGYLYAAKVGDSTLTLLENVRRDVPTFSGNETPAVQLSFVGDYPYIVVVSNRGQSTSVQIPLHISH